MKTVHQLLQAKGSAIISVAPDSNVFDALKVMAERESPQLSSSGAARPAET